MQSEQLRRLVEAARRPRRKILILPTATGEHGSMCSGFITLKFANPADPPVVYLETRAGSRCVEVEDEVRQHTSLFRRLSATALSAR